VALMLASIATLIGIRSAWTMSGTSGPRNDCRQIAISPAVGGGGWVGEFYKAALCVVPASPPLRKPRLSHEPPRASAFHLGITCICKDPSGTIGAPAVTGAPIAFTQCGRWRPQAFCFPPPIVSATPLATLCDARSYHRSIVDRATSSARSRGPMITFLGLSMSAG
jgi:hypothetical protein